MTFIEEWQKCKQDPENGQYYQILSLDEILEKTGAKIHYKVSINSYKPILSIEKPLIIEEVLSWEEQGFSTSEEAFSDFVSNRLSWYREQLKYHKAINGIKTLSSWYGKTLSFIFGQKKKNDKYLNSLKNYKHLYENFELLYKDNIIIKKLNNEFVAPPLFNIGDKVFVSTQGYGEEKNIAFELTEETINSATYYDTSDSNGFYDLVCIFETENSTIEMNRKMNFKEGKIHTSTWGKYIFPIK